MTQRNGSVVRRRVLARRLRRLREEAGLTLEQAAPALDWSVSKLSRIETGRQAVDVHGVRSMLDLYDAGGDRWTELVAVIDEQVLPTAVGAHPALASGFIVLRFGDLGEPDLAYVEHTLGAVFLDKEVDVVRATLFFERLRSAALSPQDSAALIRRILKRS